MHYQGIMLKSLSIFVILENKGGEFWEDYLVDGGYSKGLHNEMEEGRMYEKVSRGCKFVSSG